MYAYELMVIYKSSTDDKKIEALFAEFLEPTGIKNVEVTKLGKKQLAYPIAKQSEGYYVFAKLKGGPVTQASLAASAKQHPEILRFLLTVTDN